MPPAARDRACVGFLPNLSQWPEETSIDSGYTVVDAEKYSDPISRILISFGCIVI